MSSVIMVMYLRMVLNFIISEPSRHFALRKEDENRMNPWMPPRISLSVCTKIFFPLSVITGTFNYSTWKKQNLCKGNGEGPGSKPLLTNKKHTKNNLFLGDTLPLKTLRWLQIPLHAYFYTRSSFCSKHYNPVYNGIFQFELLSSTKLKNTFFLQWGKKNEELP